MNSIRKFGPGPLILLFIGIVLSLIPLCLQIYWMHTAKQEVVSISESTGTMDADTKAYYLAQAKAYNARLGNYDDDSNVDSILSYEEQLNVDGTGSMAWLEIPKLDLTVLVYHKATDENVLAAGCGHMEETSLPVGGEISHCYIAGHSGMPAGRVFDGIRNLEAGDIFVLHTLDDAYAYQVTSWEVVDPDDDYYIDYDQPGDTVTLVTCTTTPNVLFPKGALYINDKRLLVHAERVEYVQEDIENTPVTTSAYVNDHTLPALTVGAILLVVFVIVLIRKIRKIRRSRT